MNISQPIASHIGGVHFDYLSSADIKALSVKKIQNATTFDTLLHPTPGGLYDPALGAYGDNACSTCHLNSYACPGHVGHIELPIPIYHPNFLAQLMKLLRARCAYCNHLKLEPIEVHRFACKFRLIHCGLLQEAAELENVHQGLKKPDDADEEGSAKGSNGTNDDDMDKGANEIMEQRNAFVRRMIKKAGGKRYLADLMSYKIEAVHEERRAVIKEFMGSITKTVTCGSCKGISPSYRKDGYNKIFRKPLGVRTRAKMVQGNFRAANPLVEAMKAKKDLQKQKHEEREMDEGIVIDFDDISLDEDDEEDLGPLEMDKDVNNGDMLDNSASVTKTKETKPYVTTKQTYVNPQEVHAAISELFNKEQEIFDLVYDSRIGTDRTSTVTADMFFIHDILVPPNKYRPEAKTGDDEIAEAERNNLYKLILNSIATTHRLRLDLDKLPPDSDKRHRSFNDLQNSWIRIQDAVNSLIDQDRNPIKGNAGKQIEAGIKQNLEKKEGLFRKNMMGKRVNFAARSVISPDPNIETNEIGVPPVFAMKLTYPEPVTNHNFYELKEAVLNGVSKWPGASAIENENGQVINLRTKNADERQALANQLLAPSNTTVTGARNKKVHRHLNNGDIVLMNRQPTLHKPSIMGHRARVLPGEKTIRMHYANCNTYNADFDGDEMNMHFPQNEIARAEALQIADTDHQYLVATSGKPLRGLIQDHISMGVWLTNKDSFFDRDDYFQLLYSCLRPENNHTATDRIQSIHPAILKPIPLWTGKQVITTVLRNITPSSHPGLTLLGRSQTPGDRWGSGSEEGVVIFQHGELLCGILDKAHLGPTNGGFIHSIYEAYGHTIAGKLLSVLGRLLTKLLHMRAFSCGIEDIVLTKSGDRVRQEKLKEAEIVGREVARKYVTLEAQADSNDSELCVRLEDVMQDDVKRAGLDAVYNSRTSTLSSEITKACLPSGLRKAFPYNQMQAMTTSGAKGSVVNANLISCNLGQQVLEGARVPVMISGKTLPSFKPFETKVRAGGYITDRFLTGVKPQEYYFHAMAGREGLIDTAVKTSRSGYLQRCLIKGMEGLRVEYDTSVRDSDGSMIQFLYGEDGLDVIKQKHLTDYKFLAENHLSLVAQLNIGEEYWKISNDEAKNWHKVAMRKVRKTGRIDVMDPVLAIYNPGSVIGSTSESFASTLKAYCDENPQSILKPRSKGPDGSLAKNTFITLLNMKYMKSVVDPGEAVGIVAGQSIGEPSTQMTLNTFHLAGHSTKNVTLGIPRLREIVMTASNNISTPSMTLHLIPEMSKEEGEKFAKGITKLTLAEVIDEASVSETIAEGMGYHRAKIYDIRLKLFSRSEYQETYAVKDTDVLHAIEYRFVPQLIRAVTKELKEKGDAKLLKKSTVQPEIGQMLRPGTPPPVGKGGREEGQMGGDDGDDDGDNDATNNKTNRNQTAAISYEAPDEGEAEIAHRFGRHDTPDLGYDEGYVGSPRETQDQENRISSEGEDHEYIKTAAKEREARLKEKNRDVARFSFDDKDGKWCNIQLEYDVSTAKLIMLNHVESACRSTVIQSIHGLSTCFLSEESDPKDTTSPRSYVVHTEGVNLKAMHNFQHIINPHRIFTNDVAAMLALYGVEAARAIIVREMDAVFKGHSITVDNRHLNLIADMMTRGGGFSAFNRTGMTSAVSPLMKMSFETTVGFLNDAVLQRDWDDLRGPSARIVTGKVSRVGTGAFDVMMPVT